MSRSAGRDDGMRPPSTIGHHLAIQKDIDWMMEKANGRTPSPDAVPKAVVFRCRLAFELNQFGDPETGASEYRLASKRDPEWPRKFAAEA